jgi:hypothetical protein
MTKWRKPEIGPDPWWKKFGPGSTRWENKKEIDGINKSEFNKKRIAEDKKKAKKLKAKQARARLEEKRKNKK